MIGGLAAAAALLGGAAHGAFYRNSPIFGRPITKLDTSDRAVALTFDDGPNPQATPLILDALATRGARATFFILGRHAERWPEIVRRIAEEGHAIGNHGYYHRKLHFKSPR
ncbi:MAG TPA: polysaccharide deacetylase family protein, partial [Gemmatimonadaceae bacterium]